MFKLNGWGLRQSRTVCPTEEEKRSTNSREEDCTRRFKNVLHISSNFLQKSALAFAQHASWQGWFLSRICFFTKRLGVLTETPSFQGFRTGSLEIMSLGVFAQVFLVHAVPSVLTLFISLPPLPSPPPWGKKCICLTSPPPPDHNKTF